MGLITRQQILDLLETGIRASSADNCQPWLFKIEDDGFELWVDSSQMGHFFDVRGVATLISCGTFLENIEIYSRQLGLEARIALDPVALGSGRASRLGRVFFHPGPVTPGPGSIEETRRLLWGRHTDRFPYRPGRKVPDEVIRDLARTLEPERGYRLHTCESPHDRKEMIRILLATEALRFSHERVHLEFYEVLRFGRDVSKTRDGLAEETLGIGAVFIAALRLLKPWPLTRFLQFFGLHHLSAWVASGPQLRSSSLIVSIVHSDSGHCIEDSFVRFIEFGRVMQRFWLRANETGLGVQPYGALPLFLARLRGAQGEGFSKPQLEQVARLERRFADITPGFVPERDRLVMQFRLGFAKKKPPTSKRRMLESFLMRE